MNVNPYNTGAGQTGEVRFYELAATGTDYTGFKAPDALAANILYTLPGTAPTNGQVLSSTAGGVLSWVAIPSAPVTSVNGATGVVVLTTSDVAEGTNKYHTDARVIAAPLTAYSIGTNTALAATDTVLQGMQKLEGQIASKQATITATTSADYYRGDKTFATLDTLAVPENTNLYYTNARAIGATLTGYSIGTNTALAATDTILQGMQKLEGQVGTKLASSSFVDWSVAGVQTLEPTRLNLTTASRAVATNASGVPVATAVTATELGYLSGVTSAIQTQLNALSSGFVNGGNTVAATASIGTNSAHNLEIETSGTTRMTLDTSGNVGVGMTPSFPLHVNGNLVVDGYGLAGGSGVIARAARGTLGSPTAIQSGDYIATFGARGYGATGFSSSSSATTVMTATENWTDSAQGTALGLWTTANGTAAGSKVERVRVDQNGYVGIGTTSPTSMLDVRGVATINTANTAKGTLAVKARGTTNNDGIYLENPTNTNSARWWIDASGIQRLDNGSIAAGDISLNGSGTGNVAIGTTTAGAKLEVAGQVKITGGTPGAGKVLTSDAAGLATWETPTAAPVTSVNGATGVVVLTTTNVAEGTNLYYTNARGIASVLTGYSAGSNTALAATDTILQGMQKLEGQVGSKLASSSFVDWSTAGVQTLEPTRLNLTTASRAVVTNGSGVPTASSVTSTELGYVSGVTSAIQTQLNTKFTDGGNTLAANGTIGINANYDLGFKTNSTVQMTLKNDGKVGIGTNSPSTLLDVRGSVSLNGIGSGYGVLGAKATGTTNADGFVLANPGMTNSARWWIDASGIQRLDNGNLAQGDIMLNGAGTGNVGIGTTTAGAKLEVNGQVKITGGTPGAGKVLTSDANGLASWTTLSSGVTGSGTTNYLPKFTGASTVGNSLVVDTGSAVGVNTASPSTVFHVVDTSSGWPRGAVIENVGGSSTSIIARRARGSVGSPAAVQSGDALATYTAQGYNGSGYPAPTTVPGFKYFATENWTGSNNGMELIFYTTPNGTVNGVEILRMSQGGLVGIGNASPTYKLDVTGDINSSTRIRVAGTEVCTSAGCTVPSDERLKENVFTLTDSLDKLLKVRGVEYNYIDTKKFGSDHKVGLIAQEVEKVFPEVVRTDKVSGFKSVAYDNLVAPLIEAVKSLYYKIIGVENKVERQGRAIASVDDKVKKLEIENAKKDKEIKELRARLERIEAKLK